MGCGLQGKNKVVEEHEEMPTYHVSGKEIFKLFKDHYYINRDGSCSLLNGNGSSFQVKYISKYSFENNDERIRFIEEMEILKQTDHPNIVKVYDVLIGNAGVNYHVVEETIHVKASVEEYLNREDLYYPSEAEIAKMLKQLLSAVVYCHSKNVLHRNLHPGRLNFKVSGFGSSKCYNIINKEKLYRRDYEAPEVLINKSNFTKKSDVWSCGAILFRMLCKSPPFEDVYFEALKEKICKGLYSFDGREVPPEAQDLIKLMLTIDPQERCTAEEALNHPWIKKMAPK